MKPIQQRSADEGVGHHRTTGPRVYDGDWVHDNRLREVRKLIAKYLPFCSKDIIELGCGTGDISGPFAEEAMVLGFDCNDDAVKLAKKRFPLGCFMQGEIDKLYPTHCGVLVLSEVLEHLHDPLGLVKKWGALCEYMVISHPLDEDVRSGLSGGDHQWSFDEKDFAEWFQGFQILDKQVVEMGSYRCILGAGKRIDDN